MCNCGKNKVSADDVPATAAKSRPLEAEELAPYMLETVSLGLRSMIRVPLKIGVPTNDGGKTTMTLRQHSEKVQRQFKLRLMHNYPHLFEPTDSDWQYASDDERASALFRGVSVNV